MKKKLIPFVFVCLLGFLNSCGDKNDDPVVEVKEYTVRYEASCANPSLYKLNVTYSVAKGSGQDIKTETVESPFSVEVKLKTGMAAALDIFPVYKEPGIDPHDNRVMTGKVYVDGKLEKEATSDVIIAIAVPIIEK